jgi:hypothetical protein
MWKYSNIENAIELILTDIGADNSNELFNSEIEMIKNLVLTDFTEEVLQTAEQFLQIVKDTSITRHYDYVVGNIPNRTIMELDPIRLTDEDEDEVNYLLDFIFNEGQWSAG